jgi:hypothetical protein
MEYSRKRVEPNEWVSGTDETRVLLESFIATGVCFPRCGLSLLKTALWDQSITSEAILAAHYSL